jgi:ABC-type cobalamin/Fe3+-siderophores transport system ATPase subunit
MDVEVTLSNYRCFSDTPVRFALKKGLHAFVGVNNSGKSCLLRMFYELRHLFQLLPDVQTLYQTILGNRVAFQQMPQVKDLNEIFCDRNERDLVLAFDMEGGAIDGVPTLRRFEIVIPRGTNTWFARAQGGDGRQFPQTQELSFTSEGLVTRNVPGGPQPIAHLGPIKELGSLLTRMVYLGPFRNAVNVGGSNDYYDIQIGQRFITAWKTLKTGYQKKQSEATYKLTDDIRRIFGFETLDINASDDGENLQLMIDGKSYKQSEVGSGLIQFILVLVNAAIRSPSYILIDEPELNLHPSLQVDFLTTLASYAEFGVLFATHNLGLARAVSDRVYSVRKVGRDGREVRDFTGTRALAEFLGELGFNAYQDLGYETVLLVEGPTDVTCAQQLLRLYGREHQIVFLNLGGSSLINSGCAMQLEEITRISPRVHALIDSEREHAGQALRPDRRGFADVCAKLKIPCHVLERRAIENYLPERAIRVVKNSDKYRALGHYEALKALSPAWGKEENWKIARLMTKDDLSGTDLGAFLEKL